MNMQLLEKFKLGKVELDNRIVMAPMTRSRAIDNTPNELMVEYYRQRAGAGLIITEGTSPSPNGLGYPRIPGAYSDAQIAGWKLIAEAVHDNGGKIFVQLMHTGRISAKPNLPENARTVAPSAIQAAGQMYCDGIGMKPHDIPHALSEDEVRSTIEEYATSAQRLVEEAGVDGVELHGANGYLIEQFINPKSNSRTDNYGGSYENRARFAIDVAKAVAGRIGADRVGIRLSPYGSFNDVQGVYDGVESAYKHLAAGFGEIGLAYLHIIEQSAQAIDSEKMSKIKQDMQSEFGGPIITGGDVNSREKVDQVLNNGFDLVYVGRPFIANPDFVEKIQEDKELTTPDSDLFYTPGPEGYTTYS